MGNGLTQGRHIARETLLALLVLAVAFLNFGHVSVSFAHDGTIVTTAGSFCGDPLNPTDTDHAPCHACRIGGAADLPPVPCAVVPVAFAVVAVSYDEVVSNGVEAHSFLAANPRAPPVA